MELMTIKNKNGPPLIKDVLLYPLKVNSDESGILVETLRKDWKDIYSEERKFSMQYFSVTKPWVARDENLWHCHNNQEDRLVVSYGQIVVAIADNRGDSETKGLLNLFRIDFKEDPYVLLIPKKTLHGFMVISETEGVLLNFPTQLYNGKDEIRIPYDTADIKFPDGNTFSWETVRKSLNS